jgi:hypothetical protein
MSTDSTLRVLVPTDITDSVLISTSVAEDDYPVWAVDEVCGLGTRRIKSHRIWESLAAGNVGHDPTDIKNRIGAAPWWADKGATNRWKMFDGESSSQTVASGSLTVVLQPGHFNGFYLAGLVGNAISAVLKDAPGGNVLFLYTGLLDNSRPRDYDSYFWSPKRQQRDFLATSLAQYYNAELTVTLTGSVVKCGIFAVGNVSPLGVTQWGAKAIPKSFSYVKTDDYGETTIKRRKKAKNMTATAMLEGWEANDVLSIITDLSDVPCCWFISSLPQHEGLRGYGLGNGEITYISHNNYELSLTVNGTV